MEPLILPDYPASLFSLSRLPELLRSRGALLLRNMLPAHLLQQWLPVFVAAYEEADRQFQNGEMAHEIWHNFYRYGQIAPHQLPGYPDWLQQLLKQPGLRNLFRAALGPDGKIFASYSTPRRQSPVSPDRAVCFHQDQEFMGPLQRCINVWIPLTAAGGQHPGLEIWLDGPQETLLNFGMEPDEREQICARMRPEQHWKPELKAGDVLVFTHYTVHRTWMSPEMSQARYSYELRLISAADCEQAAPPLLTYGM